MQETEEEQRSLLKAILNEEISGVELKTKLAACHHSEISHLLESLPSEDREDIWALVPPENKGEVLLELHGDVKEQLIDASHTKDLVDAVKDLQIDEIADLNETLPEEVVNAVVQTMDVQKKADYDSLKDYPDDTAGGLMDVDAIKIRGNVTIEVALRYLRMLRRKYNTIPEHMDTLFVIGEENNFLGVVELKDLVSMDLETTISDMINVNIEAITDTTTATKVAQIFEDRDLMSAPVVNEQNVLLGRITVDDVIDVIRSQGEELLLRPAGLSEDTDVFAPVLDTFKYRSLWLGVNLINSVLAAFIINMFSPAIEKVVALAVLMPIVASMGGIVGNQTLILVTRGLALEQVTNENKYRLLIRELMVGFLNGSFWAVILGSAVYVWLHNYTISVVFGSALLFSLLVSATAGTLIPLILRKLKIDPAVAGSVLLVAFSDVLGFFIFLGIATLFL